MKTQPWFELFFFLNNKFIFIGVQFANIQNNTQCSSRQVPPSGPVTPTPCPPPLPPPLVRFPELGVFMFCLPFWYFLPISSPFPSIPFHYYLYSPNEWEHTMFVLLRLTYFTQHNTLQFHPCRSKWWVLSFLMAEEYSIVYIDHIFFIHSSFDRHWGSLILLSLKIVGE